jgi:hypothetical protein
MAIFFANVVFMMFSTNEVGGDNLDSAEQSHACARSKVLEKAAGAQTPFTVRLIGRQRDIRRNVSDAAENFVGEGSARDRTSCRGWQGADQKVRTSVRTLDSPKSIRARHNRSFARQQHPLSGIKLWENLGGEQREQNISMNLSCSQALPT